ncbi:amine oxidase [Ancylostoma caninum]|uniref:Amine oxidase n=1 Tax=Ancylostoma caninum TaxID=29170 RepID=A0A368H264_ANCCA|nr:amine oxidase [Ancylostoma caninum]
MLFSRATSARHSQGKWQVSGDRLLEQQPTMRSLTLLIVVIACGISVQRESNKGEPSIAVIGAGMSGLSAARRLIEIGRNDIDIYEGLDRIGGRVHPVPYYGGYLQMGAQYINGANNPIYKIATKLGVVSEIVSDTAHLENPEYLIGTQPIAREDIELFANFVEPLDPKYRKLAKEHDLLSRVYTIKSIFMEDYSRFLKQNNITAARKKIFDALTRSYRSYWEFEWAADWADLSPRVLTEFNDRGTEGESFLTNKLGYKAILDHLRLPILDTMFHFNTTVTNIEHSPEGVFLTTSSGKIAKRYDYVIVTSSLGHLKKYHRQLFTPSLPRQKIEAIEKIGFGGSCKIFFRWEQPWWNNHSYSIIPLPVEGMARYALDSFERELTTLQVLDWEPNTLTAWVAGAGQRVMDNMSDDEMKERITTLIRDMKNDQSVPPPSEIIRTKLTKNELLLGSYSYMSLAQAKARISHSRLAIPIKHKHRPKVMFAGEATHHRLFQTAIGAYLSGRREADRLVADWNAHSDDDSFTLEWQGATATDFGENNIARDLENHSRRSNDVVIPRKPAVLYCQDLHYPVTSDP